MVGQTVHLRAELGPLLRRLNVRTLVDAPCGDLNWLSLVNLTGVAYIGIDVDAARLSVAARRAATWLVSGSVLLSCADILATPLPRGDALLCRDFFQHLPTPLVMGVLDNFLHSGASWLLATSHAVETNADLDALGGFRPLNLQVAPFGLVPAEQIEDPPGSGRILGAWSWQTVASAFR